MSLPAQTESSGATLPNAPLALIPSHAQQLRALKVLASIRDYAYTFDTDGRFIYCNQALLDLLGLDFHEVVGKTFMELPYPPDLAVKLYMQIKQVFATKRTLTDETEYTSPSGLRGIYEYIFNPVTGPNGEVEAVAGSTREISHRKVDEELQGRLAAIIDSSADAIISKDLNGIVLTWNPAATHTFGYTAHEMVGTSILRLIPVNLRHEEVDILTKVKAGQRIDHYHTVRLRKDGSMIDISLTISPIRNSAGVVVGTSKIARDISLMKKMERQLIQAEKIATMGRMAATIAHEINNPLAAIMNLVFLAKDCCGGNPEAVSYLKSAERELRRVSHIARQTMGYYRDTGARTAIACNELINEVVPVYESKMRNRGITVERDFDVPPLLVASKGELSQVFSNLIANAVDAMPDGGCLRIQIKSSTPGEIQIVFEDQGIGIQPENLSRVFEPFFTTKGNLGTGIGLGVARQLVEQHGGRMDLSSSVVPGHSGTTVDIVLPLSKSQGASRQVTQ